jgi:hypothetical protein
MVGRLWNTAWRNCFNPNEILMTKVRYIYTFAVTCVCFSLSRVDARLWIVFISSDKKRSYNILIAACSLFHPSTEGAAVTDRAMTMMKSSSSMDVCHDHDMHHDLDGIDDEDLNLDLALDDDDTVILFDIPF